MLPGKKYNVEDIVRAAWRRKWLIAVPLVVVSLAVAAYARSLPDVYRSQTTILIVPQRVPESYVRSTVTSRIEDRLPSLRQQILSRDRLERTIREFDLYRQERAAGPVEAVVEEMRLAIDVNIVRGDAFSVSYISSDPRSAMLVAQGLASQFIEENVRERGVLAEGTSAFLETQLVEARNRLEDHERKLAEYRRRYSGELPSQLDSNLQILNDMSLQAQGLANDVARDRDREAVLDRSIAEARDVAPPAEPAATDRPAATVTMAERLATSRAALDELLMRLTPEHPDVAAAQRLVVELERKALAEARAGAADGKKAPPQTVAETVPSRRTQELRLEKESLERQIARKEEEQARIRALMATYRGRVETTPARESEMIGLTRDYTTLQQIYTGLLAKKEDSAVAANLERRQIGEQFKVLEPARVPQQPFSPNRLQINMLGVLAGLTCGLGLAALLEYRDATIKTEDDVRTCLALPVLAAIPVIAVGTETPPRSKAAAAEALRVARRLMGRATNAS